MAPWSCGAPTTTKSQRAFRASGHRVIGILCSYGAGVVLIRETVQRLGLNGWGLLLLGTAYAVLEEGLGLQTIFNPQGQGGGETVYGRAFEVNWICAVVVTGYHVVWSIVIPIVLTHLLFPGKGAHLVALIGSQAPFVWWMLASLMFVAFFALVLRRWVTRPAWGGRHQLAAIFGAVSAAWVFGLLLVSNGNRTDDIVFIFSWSPL